MVSILFSCFLSGIRTMRGVAMVVVVEEEEVGVVLIISSRT